MLNYFNVSGGHIRRTGEQVQGELKIIERLFSQLHRSYIILMKKKEKHN